jgi:hypothetical protein
MPFLNPKKNNFMQKNIDENNLLLVVDFIKKEIINIESELNYKEPYNHAMYMNTSRRLDGAKLFLDWVVCNYIKSQQAFDGIDGVIDTEEDVFHFAEWISNNQFTFDGILWVSSKIHYMGFGYSTKQLFKQYKNPKQ